MFKKYKYTHFQQVTADIDLKNIFNIDLYL